MARLNHAVASTPVRQSSSALMNHTPQTDQRLPQGSHLSPTSSDKENQPAPAARVKGKGRMQPPSTLPTPNSADTSASHSAKRRRLDATHPQPPTAPANHDEEYEGHKWYDPTQDQAERQEIKRKSRALERDFNGTQSHISPLPALTLPSYQTIATLT